MSAIITDEHYRQWAASPGYSAQLLKVFSGVTKDFTDADARESRRLQWEYRTMSFPLPESVIEKLQDIRSSDPRSWFSIGAVLDPPILFAARSSMGIQEGLRLVWAEIVSRRMLSNQASNTREYALRVEPIIEKVNSREDPHILSETTHPESDMGPAYAFGRQYNRILHPPDPFEYMKLLDTNLSPIVISQWEHMIQATGCLIDKRPDGVAAMNSALVRTPDRSARHRTENRSKRRIQAAHIRQVSGVPGAPGQAAGHIWNSILDSTPPAGNVILVIERWNNSYRKYLPRIVGFVEIHSGRGGAGEFLARTTRIPSLCEAVSATELRSGLNAVIDGETGIVTVLDEVTG